VDNIKTDLGEQDGLIWTGLIWLRIGTSGRVLGTLYELWGSKNVGKFLSN
jgi:hypothetical protein